MTPAGTPHPNRDVPARAGLSKLSSVCADPKDYPHRRVGVELERAVRRATELEAFLYGVPYRRYGKY